MNKIKTIITLVAGVLTLALLSTGCTTAVNTKDVTDITITETGLSIDQNPVTQLYKLTFGRSQVRYQKIPTGLNATNATADDVSKVPSVVTAYEANTHSAVFGNASVSTTTATGDQGVQTTLGGAHPLINAGVGTGSNLATVAPAPAAGSTAAVPALPVAPPK